MFSFMVFAYLILFHIEWFYFFIFFLMKRNVRVIFLLKNFTQIIYQFRLHQACLYSIIDIPLQMATTLIEQIT